MDALHEIVMRNINHGVALLFIIISITRYLILSGRGVMEMEGWGRFAADIRKRRHP